MFQSNPSVAEPDQREKMEGVPGSALDASQKCKMFQPDLGSALEYLVLYGILFTASRVSV